MRRDYQEAGFRIQSDLGKLKAWSEAAAGSPAQTNTRQCTQARIMHYMKPGCQAAA